LIKEGIADRVTMGSRLNGIGKFRVAHVACDLLLSGFRLGRLFRQGGLDLLGGLWLLELATGYRPCLCDHVGGCGYEKSENDGHESAFE
jgi:hypothetical protein